jgi:hypothetical protein
MTDTRPPGRVRGREVMAGTCQAKQPMIVPGMWQICGSPATFMHAYRCQCGHSRQGETCPEHAPIPGEVGCAQCWDNGHECPMISIVGHNEPT